MFRSRASGVEGEISKVQFPVWSEQNGQDDIVWYAGVKQEDGTWTVSVPVKNHKSTGNYAVHVYGIKDGKQQFLKATFIFYFGTDYGTNVSGRDFFK